jgi:hypothetical protein
MMEVEEFSSLPSLQRLLVSLMIESVQYNTVHGIRWEQIMHIKSMFCIWIRIWIQLGL